MTVIQSVKECFIPTVNCGEGPKKSVEEVFVGGGFSEAPHLIERLSLNLYRYTYLTLSLTLFWGKLYSNPPMAYAYYE